MDLILKVLELDLEVGHAGGRISDDDRLQLPPEVLGAILLLAVKILTQPPALLLWIARTKERLFVSVLELSNMCCRTFVA
jgi:hypothetical protein